MKKKVLLTATLAAAMTAGMAMTAFAGWVQENGEWSYYKDSTGEKVTNDWAQSGDYWYYLGSDGRMVRNSMIEDTYYVDGNGAMTVNGWQYIEDEWDEEPAWRFFGSNGRVYRDGIKQINGVYYHFSDTKMSTGWVEENDSTYYFKDDGSMATGWRYLYENDDDEDGWEEYWYYFNTNGKLVKEDERTISGVNYVFDGEGRMLTDWVNVEDFTSSSMDNLSSSSIGDLKYFNEDGAAVTGWYHLASPVDNEENYFYFKDGKAYTANYKTTSVGEYGFGKIDGEYYCFDSNGNMITGIVEADSKIFYFDPSDGKMRTGRVTVYDDEYYNETFFFKESGAVGTRGSGITGVQDGYLYRDGQAVCADEGMKYKMETVNGLNYVVNESGKIKTSGTAKDADGLKYTIKKNSAGGYDITTEYVD